MTTTTPPPPKSGSGGYIAAAAVMLLLMGGLIFWKLRGKEEPKPAEPPVASQTPEPVLDAPPPPPPTIEADAGKQEVVRRKGAQRPASGGCNGECTGADSFQLRSALSSKAGQAQRCYERALLQNSTLQGRLAVSVRVGSNGQVCSANIASNALGDVGIASCVLNLFRSATFPAPQGGCVDTVVPMNFVPKT
jgi:hypothetical protein